MIASKKDNKEGTLLSYKELAEDSNLSINTVRKLAIESGSLLDISPKIKRVDKEKFYSYLREKYAVKSDD